MNNRLKIISLILSLLTLSLLFSACKNDSEEKPGTVFLEISDADEVIFCSAELEIGDGEKDVLSLVKTACEDKQLSLETDGDGKNIVSIQGLSTASEERKFGYWSVSVNGEEKEGSPSEITVSAGDKISLAYSATRLVSCTVSFYPDGSDTPDRTEVIENFGAKNKTPLVEYMRYLLVNIGVGLEFSPDESAIASYEGITAKTESGVSYGWVCTVNDTRVYNISDFTVPDGAVIAVKYVEV